MATQDLVTGLSPRKWYVSAGFTEKDLLALVHEHDAHRHVYESLSNYYRGKHDVMYRSFEDPTKPNNRLVNNYPKLIVDTATAYFLGEHITYVSQDKQYVETVNKINKMNQAADVDAELGKLSGIHGHAFEVHWIDAAGQHRFKQVSAYNCMMVHEMGIEEKPVAAIVYHKRKDVVHKGEVYDITIYTATQIIQVRQGAAGKEILLHEAKEHYFNEVPVIEVVANEERMGDFEDVITLVDAYNIAQSDSVNDIEYWNDSYLVLKNLDASNSEDISNMKQNRVMLVDGDGDAFFIDKKINDHHIQNVKTHLIEDIHKFSMTPNLSKVSSATNLSGVAIKFMMMDLENKVATKERKFYAAIMKRLRLITTILNKKGRNFDVLDIEPVFNRNLPANMVELGDFIVKTKNTISDDTLRAQVPFIHDLEEEARKVKKQQQELFQDYGATLQGGINQNKQPKPTPGNTKAQEDAKNQKPVTREAK